MATVAPSILSANFAILLEEVKEVESLGAEYLHIDVMDGHFVPNITLGPTVYKDLKGQVEMVFDVHLMIENPEKYIKDFAAAGADIITVHYEAVNDLSKVIALIKSFDCKAGVSVKPMTDITVLDPFLDELDLVLVMSVEPGFGGQKFMPVAFQKISYLHQHQDKYNYLIEVDGGINAETGKLCVNAGADILVAGSYIFNSADRRNAINSLLAL